MSVYVNDFRKIKKAHQHAHQRSRHAIARSAPGDVAVAGCGLPALTVADVGRVREMKRWRERGREMGRAVPAPLVPPTLSTGSVRDETKLMC